MDGLSGFLDFLASSRGSVQSNTIRNVCQEQECYTLFYKQHFFKQQAKNQVKAKKHPETELLAKTFQKTSVSVSINYNENKHDNERDHINNT